MSDYTVIASGLSFLAGCLVTQGVAYKMRIAAKQKEDEMRKEALAYTHAIQLTDFLASVTVFKESFSKVGAIGLQETPDYSIVHSFALHFELFLTEAAVAEKAKILADVKPVADMIAAYLKDFHLSAEKLADLPRNVILSYNRFQLSARRIATELEILSARLSDEKGQITAELLCRIYDAYHRHIESTIVLRDDMVSVAKLTPAEVQNIYDAGYKSVKGSITEIDKHTTSVAAARASLTPSPVCASGT